MKTRLLKLFAYGLAVIFCVVSVYLFNRYSEIHHIPAYFFWITLGLGIFSLFDSEYRAVVCLTFSLCLLSMNILWILPISRLWSIIPFWIVGCVNGVLIYKEWQVIFLASLVTAFMMNGLYRTSIELSDSKFIDDNVPATKIIERLDIIDKKGAFTYWADEGVVMFDPSTDVTNLKVGDTIRVYIRDHKVISYEKL